MLCHGHARAKLVQQEAKRAKMQMRRMRGLDAVRFSALGAWACWAPGLAGGASRFAKAPAGSPYLLQVHCSGKQLEFLRRLCASEEAFARGGSRRGRLWTRGRCPARGTPLRGCAGRPASRWRASTGRCGCRGFSQGAAGYRGASLGPGEPLESFLRALRVLRASLGRCRN